MGSPCLLAPSSGYNIEIAIGPDSRPVQSSADNESTMSDKSFFHLIEECTAKGIH